MDSAPGPQAGRYRLLELQDEEFESWFAEDLEDPGTRVLVRFLTPGSDILAARHTVETLAGLETDGIVPPIDEGETQGGNAYLVYPYVDAITLRELLKQTGPLSLARAGGLLRHIGHALSTLHERGMVHGYVAPDRILIRSERNGESALLLDAGVFRASSDSRISPAYQAPEQLNGEAKPASDLWSLAAVATEMITGRRAFRYSSLKELERMHRIGIARGAVRKRRPKLPYRAEEELRRGLTYDLLARPSDIATYADRLAESLGRSGVWTRRRLATGFLLLLTGAVMSRNCRRRLSFAPRNRK